MSETGGDKKRKLRKRNFSFEIKEKGKGDQMRKRGGHQHYFAEDIGVWYCLTCEYHQFSLRLKLVDHGKINLQIMFEENGQWLSVVTALRVVPINSILFYISLRQMTSSGTSFHELTLFFNYSDIRLPVMALGTGYTFNLF